MTTTTVKSPTKRGYHKKVKMYPVRTVRTQHPHETEKTEQLADREQVTSGPKRSYHAALNSWFLAPDGCIRNIGRCEDAEFVEFITALIPAAWRPCDRNELFSSMQLDRSLARFYILDDLAARRIKVPLFSTEQEAADTL